MYYVYIIHSVSAERYYIGSAEDWGKRLKRHNGGQVRSTKAYVPWELAHVEEYPDRTEARKRELQLKHFKSGDAFRNLVRARSAPRE